MSQEQVQKQTDSQSQPDEEVEAADLTNEELSDDVDNILADIDDILEENAEQFVKSYVQRGGE